MWLVRNQPDDACKRNERVHDHKSTGSIIITERIEKTFLFFVMPVIVSVVTVIFV
jgi:hypothetical protein